MALPIKEEILDLDLDMDSPVSDSTLQQLPNRKQIVEVVVPTLKEVRRLQAQQNGSKSRAVKKEESMQLVRKTPPLVSSLVSAWSSILISYLECEFWGAQGELYSIISTLSPLFNLKGLY
jgi:hypothetical protein